MLMKQSALIACLVSATTAFVQVQPARAWAHIPPSMLSAAATLNTDAELVAEVVESLFGSESSRQAFARQGTSIEAVRQHFSGREKELTYGEFDLRGFLTLLAATRPQKGEMFCDIGSGCGRLVLAAALAFPWARAAGVELLDDLHNAAVSAHRRLTNVLEDEPDIALSESTFVQGEASEALPALLGGGSEGQSAVVFVYATCWPGVGPYLPDLTESLAACLASGSRVVTIDKQLVAEEDVGLGRWRFTLLDERPVQNYNTHESVAYTYRLDPSPSAASASSASGQESFGWPRTGAMVMSAADSEAEEGKEGEEEAADADAVTSRPGDRLGGGGGGLAGSLDALAQAAEAQAAASEAVGEAWDDIADMERALAAELGISVEELEAYLEGGEEDTDDICLEDGEEAGEPGDSFLEAQVERMKRGGGATPEDLPYDIL